MKKELHVIFGTGPLGRSVMNELLARNKIVRMVHRTGEANVPPNVEVTSANVFDFEDAKKAAEGASFVYQCVNAPYDKWEEQFPPMQKNILEAAASAGAKCIIGENVYMYGDTNGKPITEDLPYAALTRKGKVRAQMAIKAMQMHNDGKLQITIARASDFFGPHVRYSAMGERAIGFAVQGKTASLVGNIDLPHTFTYIKDFGKALVTLAENEDAFGEVWHVPNPETISQREFMNLVFQELQAPPKMSAMGSTMLRVGGLFIPAARETVEMMYEYNKPFVVDSSKFEKRFGWKATPLKEAIKETVQWFKLHYNV